MSEQSLNKKLHLAAFPEKHWHEFMDEDGNPDYLCRHCSKLEHGRHTAPNPDYCTDISDAMQLVEWMRREKGFGFQFGVREVGRWEVHIMTNGEGYDRATSTEAMTTGKAMNKEETNRLIHDLRGAGCWHEFEKVEMPGVIMYYKCRCGTERMAHQNRENVDYFSLLTPRGYLDEAVAKCVEKVGLEAVAMSLSNMIEFDGEPGWEWNWNDLGLLATATPEQICTAIAECLKEGK